jgi:hypothetical protein
MSTLSLRGGQGEAICTQPVPSEPLGGDEGMQVSEIHDC